MTLEEFSDEFDVLLYSYSGNNLLRFDEYEKSVFLTKAQEVIVENLYTGKLLGDSFEKTEQLRRYLAKLVKTERLYCEPTSKGISPNSVVANLPPDVWFITYEAVSLTGDSACIEGKEIPVIPITQDEYNRIKNNPFRKPNLRKAVRLDIGDLKVELISEEEINDYIIRYIARPKPIVLVDLPESLEINRTQIKTPCELNPSIHKYILETAVEMAVKSRSLNINK